MTAINAAGTVPAPMSVSQLEAAIDNGQVDTVLVVFTDMQGRLMGKRMHAQFFLDEVLAHGAEACDYLLAVDIEMNTVRGFASSNWDTGYGDFVLQPDLATLRPATWLPATAMVQCNLVDHDSNPIAHSPRQVLLAQVERARRMGYQVLAGTELEFIVFDTSYEDAWDSGYRNLVPSNRYNVDYSILGTGRVEPLLRDIRNHMHNAGLVVESAKGECNLGQHEIAIKYDEVVTTADQHAVYKTAAKEIAAQHGKSLTFMAKYNEREGNSCHIHMSLRGLGGELSFADRNRPNGRSEVFEWFVAGILENLRNFTLLYAPNVNSYKRYQPGSFAPTAVAWGEDNRTCAVRVIGHGPSLRLENRVPGGDVNPYLALAGMLAAGLWGIESQQRLGDAFRGNAYEAQLLRVPTTLTEARELFDTSVVARSAFGDAVVNHYVHAADVELDAFNGAVTDWELRRSFERM